jgi:ASC-1-like (ASCH) protein
VSGSGRTPTRKDMNLRGPCLKLIADGVKTVEVRVAYESMRKIHPGMEILFRSGNAECLTIVQAVRTYGSFEEMLDHEDMRAIGGDLGESREELLDAIRDIYPPDKEALGVLAIEIERIST